MVVDITRNTWGIDKKLIEPEIRRLLNQPKEYVLQDLDPTFLDIRLAKKRRNLVPIQPDCLINQSELASTM